ncbi:DUF4190 domain-containing protein [Streptomyces sp. AV19]|nr:DUF4190 domain-containing protein [Streptomyces sp. AV19]
MPNNGFGTAALVLGIVGVVLSFTMIFGIVLGVLAVVFGAIGRAKVTKGEAANRGSATAGLILGSLALLLSVLMIVLVAIAPDPDRHRTHDDYDDDPGGTYRTSVSAPLAPAPASR